MSGFPALTIQLPRKTAPIKKQTYVLAIVGTLLAGCASLPEDVDKTASYAFTDYESTTLGQLFKEDTASHPGQSGFAVASKSLSAFRTRIAMIRLAEKSIDVQYYIWDADTAGRVMALELLKAANRGVRVRALIDDSTQSGRDNALLAYDAHPNIEVRVFNPFAYRGSRALGYMTDFDRLNHRMHNKLLVTDNSMALVGGRNIADYYFGFNDQENFRDLDIAAVGPLVRDVSASFDVFWNSSWAYPITSLTDGDDPVTVEELTLRAERIREEVAATDYPQDIKDTVAKIDGNIEDLPQLFVWAEGEVLVDNPDELTENDSATGVIRALRDQGPDIDTELLVEVAYFVPLERGVASLRKLTERGVRVRVLTNSLASNDVAAAHAGYEEFRVDLLEAGVELHELRPDSDEIIDSWSVIAGDSRSLLHTKALVWDRDTLFIGSLNLDPRSTDINTEMGLLVRSPELAQQVADYMDQGASLDNSYRVELDEEGDLIWTTQLDNGEAVQLDKEPQTGMFKRGAADIIKVLPAESQL